MNTAQIKLLVWSCVGVLAAGTTAYLALSLRDVKNIPTVTKEQMTKVLSKVPEVETRQENVISGALVDRGLKLMDWTGKPPPERPEIVETGPEVVAPTRESVSSLLKIRGIRYHGDAPADSEVIFKYLSTAQVTEPGNSDGTFLKRPGDVLDGRLNQIKIEAIYPGGVEFAFLNEPGREHEYVEKAPYDLSGHFVVVADGQQPVSRPGNFDITKRPELPPPGRTQPISPTKFRIGTDDALELNDRYPEILTSEVSIDRHRDPVTKAYDGIAVKGVKSDSIAARHGVQDGDVIKSINGTPVTSKEEAINFVKRNKDKYTEWVVEIWNKGQTRTITYYPPKK